MIGLNLYVGFIRLTNQLLTFINQHTTLNDELTAELNEITEEVSVLAERKFQVKTPIAEICTL